ncbi:hypothetical protein [Tautonia plasticadhaerens]|uniref:Uncharacterized protein n=1 Tax=Tautonia plasticadhaerens TaxID=2527974 RepID=A0A518H1Z5_9BACT|nr:hypothetical protein [Tautonia plasticadhaerens]QDV34840.1 hypothetical protein ElP_27370 [Tautonia plasticadhaerens]
MAEPRRAVGRLQIQTDPRFQRTMFAVQRAAWAVMAALLLAALLGLFGSGPVSRATAGGGGAPLLLEFERFARLDAETTLRARIEAAPGPDGTIRIRIDEGYLRDVQVRRITPEPDHAEVGADVVDYVFRARSPGPRVTVTFAVRPERAGRLRGRISLGDGTPLRFGHFVYP